jgi:hypothetical protein
MSWPCAFLVIIVVLVVVLWRAGTQKAKPGQVDMVLIGATGGEAEAHLWQSALRTAGITCRLVNVGDFHGTGVSSYAYEVWVRARDEERARRVLGL